VVQSNLSSFLVVVWAQHPDLIPTEVGCSIPEPVEPFVEAKPSLFIRASEVIHDKCDLLHFCAFIHILVVHDFNPPSSSEEDGGPFSEEEYPGYVLSPSILRPWPRVHGLITGVGPSGDPWPALLVAGGATMWSVASSRCGRHRGRARRRQVPVVQPTSMACTLSSPSVRPPSMQQADLVAPGANVRPLPEAVHGHALLRKEPIGDRRRSTPLGQGLSSGGAQQTTFQEGPMGTRHRSTL
jgi:hypothetical protein